MPALEEPGADIAMSAGQSESDRRGASRRLRRVALEWSESLSLSLLEAEGALLSLEDCAPSSSSETITL